MAEKKPKNIKKPGSQEGATNELTVLEQEAETSTPEELLEAQSEKFKRWAKLFLDATNKDFFGNRVKCALEVYDTENYVSAAGIGSQNYKKLQLIAPALLEADGWSFIEMLRLGKKKVEAGSYDDYERFMIKLGVLEPNAVKGEGVNNFNFQNLNMLVHKDAQERGLE